MHAVGHITWSKVPVWLIVHYTTRQSTSVFSDVTVEPNATFPCNCVNAQLTVKI